MRSPVIVVAFFTGLQQIAPGMSSLTASHARSTADYLKPSASHKAISRRAANLSAGAIDSG